MFGIGVGETIVLGMVAVLLFGKRLPEVAKTIGGHYAQLRRALQEVQTEMYRAQNVVDDVVRDTKQQLLTYDEDDYRESTAPQFQLPEPEESDDDADDESNTSSASS